MCCGVQDFVKHPKVLQVLHNGELLQVRQRNSAADQNTVIQTRLWYFVVLRRATPASAARFDR